MRAELPSPESIRQLPKDGGPNFNRLIFESSPYLLQHARNPIEWYPWSEEALEIARSENKPIFLSIGYTTCHWCHVMEKESFEDQEVAALLNQHYICIKVDREERPDLDNVYMSVTQMMTGRGGWPMTVIMTPQKVPFFAGTYFPKASMIDLLPHFSKVWNQEREKVTEIGQAIIENLAKAKENQAGGD
ncbi:MAG: thioredoxin domain-containing protein, partial [Opitutales bacterium]